MSHIKSERIVENTWVCNSCQAVNRGRHMKCQTCGSAKEKDEQDIVPDPAAAATVTDPEQLKMAAAGPDWICEYCGARDRNSEGKCANCGGIRPASQQHEALRELTQSAQEMGMYGPPPSPPPPKMGRIVPPNPPRKDYTTHLIVMAVIIGLSVAGGSCYFLLSTREVTAKVIKLDWTYTATLHQRTLEHGSGWKGFGTPPSDAFNVSCQTRYRGDEDCHPHDCNPHPVSYDCRCHTVECNCKESCKSLDNGFSRCQTVCDDCRECDTCSKTEYDTCYDRCPVYNDYCNYDYYDWPAIATRQTTGASGKTVWPDLQANGPEQRLDRSERYSVVFSDGPDNQWTVTPGSLADFQRFIQGSSWKLSVNRLGLCDPLGEVNAGVDTR